MKKAPVKQKIQIINTKPLLKSNMQVKKVQSQEQDEVAHKLDTESYNKASKTSKPLNNVQIKSKVAQKVSKSDNVVKKKSMKEETNLTGNSTRTYKNQVQTKAATPKIIMNPQRDTQNSISTNDRTDDSHHQQKYTLHHDENENDDTIYDDTIKHIQKHDDKEHRIHSEQVGVQYHKPLLMNKNQSCQGYSQEFSELLQSVQQKLIKIIPNSQINKLGDVIGEGGFGQVYKGQWMNMEVAIKEMILSYSEFKTMDREMSLMAQNRHQKLVCMYGIVLNEMRKNRIQCCIIMELMDLDLDDYIFRDIQINNVPSKLKEKVQILLDIAEGIHFLHLSEIVHRDIKPKNVLLNNKSQAKLTDLGIARALEDKEKTLNATVAFTARYASRETAVDEITAFSSDIWSLGLVMYELLTHKRCWDNLSNNKIIISLAKQADPFEKQWEDTIQNQGLVKLIKQCCDYEMQNRPKPQQIIEKLNEINNSL